ncbi:MAG TPA: MATE family efflux transporter [Albitalea sp.]|uniref:MATE family efflux transporter n=1 Tax=Piscinibacter sp. TaxID=1903157 RepID=UPI002ED22BF3
MSGAAAAATRPGLLHDARRIAALAWPLFVGQLAVLAFSTVDTVMTARYAALDLAALAVGSSVYITVFVGFMGVVLAIGPIAGQLFGAGRLPEAGRQLHQSMWLALALSVIGCTLLRFPEPFLALSHAEGEVAAKVRGYLHALAFALPSALLFTAFRGFNTAVSRPKIVMALQFGALLLKVPLNAVLVFGVDVGGLRIPALGAQGCGIATAIVMGVQLVAAWWVLRRDPFYAGFGLRGHLLSPPDRASLAGLLRLGLPMGLSIGIEVTGFTFMALFISRLGPTPVAGHQIAVNIVSVMFMMPLSLANATATLVAQRIGADDPRDARRIGWHGLQVALMIAAAMGAAVYVSRDSLMHAYTDNEVIIAAAMPLLAWVILFHIADAGQTVAAFTLRAYKIATVPVVIYASAIWGVGLGGGYLVAFDLTGMTPPPLRGATGFWAAATAGLTLAATGLCGFLLWVFRVQRSEHRS